VTAKIYQTLPLYNNLKTSGVYVYPENIDLRSKSAEVKVEAEVVNETGNYASITLLAFVMDNDSVVLAKLDGNTSDLIAGQTEIFTASRKGLKSAGLKIESNAVEVADGLIPAMPRTMPGLKIN
jgi:beta-galactosidase